MFKNSIYLIELGSIQNMLVFLTEIKNIIIITFFLLIVVKAISFVFYSKKKIIEAIGTGLVGIATLEGVLSFGERVVDKISSSTDSPNKGDSTENENSKDNNSPESKSSDNSNSGGSDNSNSGGSSPEGGSSK